MIIYTNQKSKKKKIQKKQAEQYQQWLDSVNSLKTSFSSRNTTIQKKIPIPKIPPGRETKHYPSLQTNEYDTFRKQDKVYTGDKMMGIGTLHKSNAVPIFTDQEAKDQANMRR